MRTAEERVKDEFNMIWTYSQFDVFMPMVIKIINEARKEAIEESAERATVKHVPPRMTNMDGVEVDKESILSLIKELK